MCMMKSMGSSFARWGDGACIVIHHISTCRFIGDAVMRERCSSLPGMKNLLFLTMYV